MIRVFCGDGDESTSSTKKIVGKGKVIAETMPVLNLFFLTLKTELIYDNKLITKEQMKTILFEYIEIYYNQKRRHSALNNQTISEFLEKYYNKVA